MKKNKVKKSLPRRICNWVFSIIIGLIFVGVFAVQIQGLTTRDKNFGVTNYFGTQFLVVETDSMVASEPGDHGYNVGTAIIVKKVDPSTIKVGDDLTFFDVNGVQMVMTHRCKEVIPPSESPDGLYNFITHGINKHSNQSTEDMTSQTQQFNSDYLLGKVVGSNDFLGGFMNFSVSIWGLLTLLLIPTGYLLISSCIDIYKAYNSPSEESKTSDGETIINSESSSEVSTISMLSEEDKKRLKQEMLEEMLATKKGDKK